MMRSQGSTITYQTALAHDWIYREVNRSATSELTFGRKFSTVTRLFRTSREKRPHGFVLLEVVCTSCLQAVSIPESQADSAKELAERGKFKNIIF